MVRLCGWHHVRLLLDAGITTRCSKCKAVEKMNFREYARVGFKDRGRRRRKVPSLPGFQPTSHAPSTPN